MPTAYEAEHGQRVVGTASRNAAGYLVRVDTWVSNDGHVVRLPGIHVASRFDTSDTHAQDGVYAASCRWCRRDESHSNAAHQADLAEKE